MQYTNKFNLPDTVVNTLKQDTYIRGDLADFSITELIDSPRIAQLKRRHPHPEQVDVVDNFYTFMGHAIHEKLSRSHTLNVESETRVFASVGNSVISGQPDVIEKLPDGTYRIIDYKLTSVWTWKLQKGSKSEWTAQLNAYAALLAMSNTHKDYVVSELVVVCFFRDWSARERKRQSDYPPTPVLAISIYLYSSKYSKIYLEERVMKHENAAIKIDRNLDHCTSEERWERPAKFAVYEYKKNSDELKDRATRLFDSDSDARAFVKDDWKKYKIVYRKGESVRCENWCAFKNVCSQYQEMNHDV